MAGIFVSRLVRSCGVEVVDEADGGLVGEGHEFGVWSVTGIEVGVFVEEASVLGAEIDVLGEVDVNA